MPRSNLLVLFILGLAVASGVAWLQNSPGYMDADYYMAGGLRLVQGHGFSEIILWNYLDDPAGLPHPSHSYWMPLASILAALGMWMTGQHDFFSARIPFILLAGFVPPLTALLAYRLTARRDLALLSGLLAVFPTYNAAFLSTTDNHVVYGVLGALFFLMLKGWDRRHLFILGFVSGLMNLARSDGLMWLALIFLALMLNLFSKYRFDWRSWVKPFLSSGLLVLMAYFLVMGPWFLRNLAELGTAMAPGGSRAALLVVYADTFIYPGSYLTVERWLESGWWAIWQARQAAFFINLGTGFGAQGGILLSPFILIAAWKLRRLLQVQIGVIAWFLLFLIMSLVFPFAGPRGSFFHAGVALLPLGWAMAPIGLEMVIAAARRRNWFTPQAQRIFRLMIFAINMALTLMLINIRVINNEWDLSEHTFRQVESRLQESGAIPSNVVMVANPPGYYLASGRPAVVTPTSGFADIFDAARKYDVRYLVLEEKYLPERLAPFFFQQDASPYLQLVFFEPDLGVVVYEFVLEK